MINKQALSGLRASVCLLAMCISIVAQTNVVTQHNDIGRTGQNVTESVLNTTNVNASTFGRLFTLSVDGAVYAQPLYLSNVSIGGVSHHVAFIATEHDSVYAFDAATGTQLWKATMLDAAHGAAANAIPEPESDTGCTDIIRTGAAGEYGITGTPVIDPVAGILYVVSETFEANYPVLRLHALDVTTGLEKLGAPVTLSASVAGTGSGSSGGVLAFDPKWENQRAGLLLLSGNVYIAFGSHCDYSPWHGWVLGYSASTLKQTGAFLSTPDGSASGIWMGGTGLAADINGSLPRIFPATGNGTYDATAPYGTNNMSYGDDILRLNVANGITVGDMFTPYNQASLSSADEDVGSGGVMVLPDQPGTYPHLLVQIGKSGVMYVVNRDNMGGYNSSANNIVQTIDATGGGDYYTGVWGTNAYWNGNVYVWPRQTSLERFPISNGLVSTTPSESAPSITYPSTVGFVSGGIPSVSANGNLSSTGIVWAVDTSQSPQILYAYNASNVSQLLWDSAQNATRDGFSTNLKYVVPTIADGKVFLGTINQVAVYGLLSATTSPDFTLAESPGSLLVAPGLSTTALISVSALNGFSGALSLTASGLPTGVTAAFTSTNPSTVTLTLTAATNAVPTVSPANITITATSGSLSHSTSLTLIVSSVQVVNMGASDNIYGVVNEGSTVTNGGLDTASYAYSAALLGTNVTALGVPFYFGTPGQANAASGVTVPLPAGTFGALNLLGTAVYGAQTSQPFLVTYTDGTTTTFTQSLSDWGFPQSYAGETTAASMSYRDTPTGGTQSFTWNLYAYSFPLNMAKTAASITLPILRNVVIVAMTLSVPPLPTQTITFGAIAAQTVGTQLALKATASSGLAITYSSSTASICTVSGSTVTLLAAGSCTITAAQTGNVNYAAATPVSQTFTVTAASQTITFTSIGVQTVGTPLTLSASASSGLAVTFAASPSSVCTVSGAIASFVAAGTCTITASQAGNAAFAAATPASQSFTVQAAATTGVTTTVVSLGSAANVYGIFSNGTSVANGGWDNASYAYSLNLLGSTLTFQGIPYSFGTAGKADAATSTTLTLPTGNYSTLNFLGSGNFGNQASQVFVVTYTDGSTSSLTQSLSDWGSPQSYSGETIASTMAYRLTPSGAQATGPWYLYAYSLSLNSAKTVKSFTLPNTRGVAVLAVTLSASASVKLTAQTISFSAVAAQTAGKSLSLTATATSKLTVSYSASPSSVCSVSGVTASFAAAGTCTITASQVGNSTYAPATPVSQSFTVQAAGR